MSNKPSEKESHNLTSRLRHHPLVALREEMDDLLSRFWPGEESWMPGRLSPSMDVAETDTTVEVRLDLPGIDPKDVDIRLSGNKLTISGERKEEKEEKGRTFHRVERRTGSFTRSMTLPCAVDEETVSANYKDGVLLVSLPKAEEAKSRKIDVK